MSSFNVDFDNFLPVISILDLASMRSTSILFNDAFVISISSVLTLVELILRSMNAEYERLNGLSGSMAEYVSSSVFIILTGSFFTNKSGNEKSSPVFEVVMLDGTIEFILSIL